MRSMAGEASDAAVTLLRQRVAHDQLTATVVGLSDTRGALADAAQRYPMVLQPGLLSI